MAVNPNFLSTGEPQMTTTTNTPETATINFYDSEIITVMVDGEIFVAARPIIEAIGLDWGTQQTKLRSNSKKFNCRDIPTVAKDGKERKMLCIPLKKLNGLLFTINPEKIPREETRKKVELYQEECFTALYDYWHSGVAVNPRFTEVFPDLETVDFAGCRITTTLFDNIEYVSVRSLIDGIGLDWDEHLKTLQDNDQEFYYRELPIIGLEGGESALAAIPVTKTIHWLYEGISYDDLTDQQKARWDIFLRGGVVEALQDFWRARRAGSAGSPTVSTRLLEEELKSAEAVRLGLEARLREVSRISPDELTRLFKAVTEGYWIVNKAARAYRELLGNMNKTQRNMHEVIRLLRQVFPDAFEQMDLMLMTTSDTH